MPKVSSLRVALLSLTLACPYGSHALLPHSNASEVEAVVRSFHDALRSGNVAAVKQLLAEDSVILESGRLESRDEYLSHHLADDIEFAKAVPSRVLRSEATINGETAWVRSVSAAAGTFRNRPVKLAGAELVVLTRLGSMWQIRAIHWSSHQPKQ